MTFFLRESLLDRTVLPLGRMELLPDSEGPSLTVVGGTAALPGGGGAGKRPSNLSTEPTCMMLNGAALENLEVLDNAEGAT